MVAVVALISDTHLYADFTAVPEWVREHVRAADYTIHCGDFVSETAYTFFRDLVEDADGTFTAVKGNADLLSADLPSVAPVPVEDVTIVATHPLGIGDAFFEGDAYRTAVLDAVTEHGGQIGVAGHTHRFIDERVGDVRILNPGSASGAAPATDATMMRLTVDGEAVSVRRYRNGEPVGADE